MHYLFLFLIFLLLFHLFLGDFSVMCRFGGHHAMTRDKTTLIFKYQNNTGTDTDYDDDNYFYYLI